MDHTRVGMDIQSSICGLTCLMFLAQKRATTARIARAGNVTERATGVAGGLLKPMLMVLVS